ncbi:hypothetical protein V1278_001060 [Bradyrhizobium sp. AZCC 1577]
MFANTVMQATVLSLEHGRPKCLEQKLLPPSWSFLPPSR